MEEKGSSDSREASMKEVNFRDVSKGDILRVREGYPDFGGCFAVVAEVRECFGMLRVNIRVPETRWSKGCNFSTEIGPQHFEFIASA